MRKAMDGDAIITVKRTRLDVFANTTKPSRLQIVSLKVELGLFLCRNLPRQRMHPCTSSLHHATRRFIKHTIHPQPLTDM